MKCKLCGLEKPLCESHMIPKFVLQWLKHTSVTGKLRPAANPNRRIQDFSIPNFLCKGCEDQFSVNENYFAKHVFAPVWEKGPFCMHYDERLLKFAVSLTWRLAAYSLMEHTWPTIVHKRQVIEAERLLRRFLLGQSANPGYDHHLIMLHFIENAQPVIPNWYFADINWYFFRGCDGVVAENAADSFAFVLLPGFVIAASMTDNALQRMHGTLIDGRGQLDFMSQAPDLALVKFLENRSYQTLSCLKQLSPQQRMLIHEMHEKNRNKIEESLAFRLFIRQQEVNKSGKAL